MFYRSDEDVKLVIMRELAQGAEIDFATFIWDKVEEEGDYYTIGNVCRAFGDLVDDSEIETDDWRTFRLAPHLRSWFEDGDEGYRDAAFADEYVGDLAKTVWGNLEVVKKEDEDDE